MYASWNGATEVAQWRVLAGASPSSLKPLTTVAENGFETAIPLHSTAGYFAAQALNAAAHVLGTSQTVTSSG